MSDFDSNSPEAKVAKWYVAHTYSGYENKVKANLEKLVENRNLQDQIQEIRIPVEISVEKVKDKAGNVSEKEIENKVFPSYVLIKMVMTDSTWHVVRNISGVTGFVGPGSKPTPLSDAEVEQIGIEKHEKMPEFKVDDMVKVAFGSFKDLSGKIIDVSADGKDITVLLPMAGRLSPWHFKPSDIVLL